MSDFVSNVKTIPYPQEQVYHYLSDLSNLERIKERINDPEFLARAQQEADKYNAGNIQERLQQVSFDQDSISITAAPLGNVCLRIIERDEPKTIKLKGEGTPIDVTLWIQLLPIDQLSTKMKLTLRAELNMFIRGMVSGPLQKGVEQLANMLAGIPYNI